MAIDIRPYGRLPVLAVWCFWGTCFYSFLTYQMYGERGRRNRVREYVKTSDVYEGILSIQDRVSFSQHENRTRSNQGLLSAFECLLWVSRLAIFDLEEAASPALFFSFRF